MFQKSQGMNLENTVQLSTLVTCANIKIHIDVPAA